MKSIVLCVFVLSCASFLVSSPRLSWCALGLECNIETYVRFTIDCMKDGDEEAGRGRFRCDYTYFAEGRGWYKLHGEPQTWRAATTTCMTEDAVLVEPTSKGMEDALLLLMLDTRVTEVRTDIQWQDDKYANHKSLTNNGTYRNVGDGALLPFACYRQLGEIVHLNECGNLDPAYRLDKRTGNCYKYFSNFLTWFDARETCSMEEGQLTIINSEDEAQVIRDIFLEHPRSPQEWKDGAFIGINKFGDDWRTVEGQKLTEAGYNVWSAGEPNNARGDEFCGSISRDGELVDDPCTRTLPFICEKKPDSGCNVHDPIADSQTFIVTKNDVGKYQVDDKNNSYYVVLKP